MGEIANPARALCSYRLVTLLGGFFFLLSGWAIAISAVALLGSLAAKGSFVAAGLALEITGLGLLVRAHQSFRGRSR
jgi:hypothetical protein